jgi:Domain of unknown function (DUF4169)
MADIINLKHARKTKARDEAEKLAAFNRQKFGRTKAEKQLTKAEQQQAARLLDGHKRGED